MAVTLRRLNRFVVEGCDRANILMLLYRLKISQIIINTYYTYNELNQLTGQVSDNSETLYVYDERGNQIHAETISEDETVSTVDMEYSVMGEMTSRTEKTGANTTHTQTNVYDQDGQRIKRTQGGTARNYYYDSGVVLYTKDGGTVSSANILSDSVSAIGTYRGSAYHTYLKDIQGSTTSIIKEDGTLSASYDYTDFGETTELTGNGFDNQICYTGGIYDKETGLYYLNARYYDPEIGRFISQDTYRGELDDPGQWHLYAYCANNPINYVDPSGHKYIWNKTVWLKGPKKDYFYRFGYIKGKKGGQRNKKMRVGSSSNNKYSINYYKLSDSKKTKCNNYKKYINNCNTHYKNINTYFIQAAIEMTAYLVLNAKDCPELAEAYRDSGNSYLEKAGTEIYYWLDDYAMVESTFKKIKKYGKKFV